MQFNEDTVHKACTEIQSKCTTEQQCSNMKEDTKIVMKLKSNARNGLVR